MIGLEIFSGSGHLSRAVRRRLKKAFCIEADLCHGPQYNMRKPAYQKEILSLIANHEVAYVWLGTPCNSWSRARRHDGRGPGPLRDDHEFLMGFPNMSEKDMEKIRAGNILMTFIAKSLPPLYSPWDTGGFREPPHVSSSACWSHSSPSLPQDDRYGVHGFLHGCETL